MNPDSTKNEIATEAVAEVNRGFGEQAQVAHRIICTPLPRHERRRQHRRQREAGDRSRAPPAVVRGLDDRVNEQAHYRSRQHEPGTLGARRVQVARGRDIPRS